VCRLRVRHLRFREPLARILAHLEEAVQVRVPADLLLVLTIVYVLTAAVLNIVTVLVKLIIRLVRPNIKDFHVISIMIPVAALLLTLEHFEAVELIGERQEVL
jgi:hypothetical protein